MGVESIYRIDFSVHPIPLIFIFAPHYHSHLISLLISVHLFFPLSLKIFLITNKKQEKKSISICCYIFFSATQQNIFSFFFSSSLRQIAVQHFCIHFIYVYSLFLHIVAVEAKVEVAVEVAVAAKISGWTPHYVLQK